MCSKLLLYLFLWCSISNVLYLEQHCFPSRTDNFQCSFRVSKLIQTFQTEWVDYSNQYSLVIHNSCSIDYPVSCRPSFTSFQFKFSSLIIIYFIPGFKSFSPTLLVAMSANCRLPSHQSILCILQFSPFLTKCTILAMCLVCLLSLSLLAIKTADLISKIIRGSSPGTIYGSLFNNSLINILKYAKAITAVHVALYSLSALDSFLLWFRPPSFQSLLIMGWCGSKP